MRLLYRFIFICIFIIISIIVLVPPSQKVKLGLDLKGGMYILARIDTSKIEKVPEDISERAVEVLRNRIDQFGVSEVLIQPQSNNYILVQLPGVIDEETRKRALELIKKTGYLEFKLVEDDKDKIEEVKKGIIPEGLEIKDTRTHDKILLRKETLLDGQDLLDARTGLDPNNLPIVRIKFTTEGAKKFAQITKENVNKKLAIIFDGIVISDPVIEDPILSGEGVIKGNFTDAEAKNLALILRAGALPAPLVIEQENTVGPTLGSDSIRLGLKAIILGGLSVVLFMCVYYILGGLIAIICLALVILFILASLSLIGGALTLPGIAGIILTLGMAVDGTILIYERLREELKKNPLPLAVRFSFDRVKATIYDANITTFLAALVLGTLGTGPIRGFGVTLCLGIIFSVFAVLFVGRTIFYSLIYLGMKKFVMFGFLGNTKIDFVKWKNVCISLSIILIIFSLFKFFTGKDIYDIDFVGGQVVTYQLSPKPNIEEIRKKLIDNGLKDFYLQEFKDIEGGIIIRSKDNIVEKLEEILSQDYTLNILNISTVGPMVGDILKKKALSAIMFSLIGILIYVAIRFKHWDFALLGVLALLHDIIISLGATIFMGYRINLLTVTALLTIGGYSINDTIVLYDRIREITASSFRLDSDIINKAINSVLSRTINTSLTTFLAILPIFLWGGEALRGFSFTLIAGFLVGTYSSIYIAVPGVLFLRKLFPKI